jgi:hypothetical protein
MRGRPKIYNSKKESDAVCRKRFAENNPTKSKEYALKYKYGITLEDYNIMLFEQDGCCAICGIHHTEIKKSLHVDHCHTTGKVRGLLCYSCNTILGHAQDDINILKKTIKYLNNG